MPTVLLENYYNKAEIALSVHTKSGSTIIAPKPESKVRFYLSSGKAIDYGKLNIT